MGDNTDKGFHRAIDELADDHALSSDDHRVLDNLAHAVTLAGPRDPDASSLAQGDDAIDHTFETPSPEVVASNPFQRKSTYSHLPELHARSRVSSPKNLFPAEHCPSIPPGASRKPPDKLGRFINLGIIGRGGMGEVYRVIDPDLCRRMVLKVVRPEHLDNGQTLARFLEEARLTSQLQHPGIVPVHELGQLDDGRYFFTMREVRGRTLSRVIAQTHRDYDGRDQRSWNAHFHDLIEIFDRLCEPVAYAHSRGIIHRDLKPSNIMVGDFGEVQLLDWGLAKAISPAANTPFGDDILDGDQPADMVAEAMPSMHQRRSAIDTHQGTIVGTPAYMPPEQAHGALDTMGPASDVYSLGAILFTILDGQRPFDGPTTANVLFQVIEGLQHQPGIDGSTPQDLIDICLRSMSRDPADRTRDAGALAEELNNWRIGSTRRRKAFTLIDEADELLPFADQLRQRARRLRSESRSLLRNISRAAPIDDKKHAWSLEEEAEILVREADAHRTRAIQSLDTALAHAPNLDEAHDRLATIYVEEHRDAEASRDVTRANSLEYFIRAHNTGLYDDYLAGRGSLSMRTRPSGARIIIFRHLQQDRRLIPGLKRTLGHTPIHDHELPMGSYLLRIEATGRTPVNYPLHIARQQHWRGHPEGDPSFHIELPFEDELAPHHIYIPGGPFIRGGPDQSADMPDISQRWIDPFVICRDPVTHGQYLTFLNDLVARGRHDDALRCCPRNVGNLGIDGGDLVYHRLSDGRFTARPDVDNFLRQPVSLVDWHSAREYAHWMRRQSGQPWRLPTSSEWEKAARGVDGRLYPWGDFLDPSWCRMLHSTDDAPGPVDIDQYPLDQSPYGVRGTAGNIRDWCLPDTKDPDSITDDDLIPFRGGCWFSTPEMCRLPVHFYKPPTTRSAGTGFRLARDFHP